MNVAVWAEIRRLAEIEKFTGRAIARRLRCSRHTVAAALALNQPPAREATPRASLLDAHRTKIEALLAKYPDLSAVRIREEIARGPEGYAGSVSVLRRYLQKVRPARGRVYQEVHYEPAQAMQVDWGECGKVQVGGTKRKVSVFVAVLCYSRLMFIEFTLSQRKAEFYRSLVNALSFFGGSPRAIIFDNLKAAVVNGSGRAACLHPEFLALCGYFCLQPVPCERRDPESKGLVEGAVRFVKHNALAGRAEELQTYQDYLAFAPRWLETVANVRMHETTRERPVDRFQQERTLLRALPAIPFDTDEVVPAVVSPHARIEFDGNRYSAPPQWVRKTITIRASRDELRLLHEGQVLAQHVRCYERGELIVLPDHRLAALSLRQRARSNTLEQAFDALGPEARQFHLHLKSRPVKTSVHLRRLLNLAQLYGRTEVLSAIAQALQLATYDAAYVENLLLAQRRRRQLPTPTLPAPKRRELIDDIDLEPPDPAVYDRLCKETEDELKNTSQKDSHHNTEEDSHGPT
jgi:transposase